MTATIPLFRPIAVLTWAMLFLAVGKPLHAQAFGVRGERVWNTGRDLPAMAGAGGWVQPWARPIVFAGEWQRGADAVTRMYCLWTQGSVFDGVCPDTWVDRRVQLLSASAGYRFVLQSQGRWFLTLLPELGGTQVRSVSIRRVSASRTEQRVTLARAGAALALERALSPRLPLRAGIGARGTVAFRRRTEYPWASFENGFSSAALQGGISYGVR